MIKLRDGELLDLLPVQLSNDIHLQCMSYAIRALTPWIMDSAERTRTHSGTDLVSTEVLDELAVEDRAPYYDQALTEVVRRDIVRNTLLWHMRAGTPAAVRELVETVFGNGDVTEWFDYPEGDGEPYTFDVETSMEPTRDAVVRFRNIIDSVKNLRSHLRNLIVEIPEQVIPLPIGLDASSAYDETLQYAPTHFDVIENRVTLVLSAYMIGSDRLPNLMEA